MYVSGTASGCQHVPCRGPQQMVDMCDISASESFMASNIQALKLKSISRVMTQDSLELSSVFTV